MANCEYCGGRAPENATRCGNCNAAITAPRTSPSATGVAKARSFVASWREWTAGAWLAVIVVGLFAAPLALWFAMMLLLVGVMVVWSQPIVTVLGGGALAWWLSRRPRRNAPKFPS